MKPSSWAGLTLPKNWIERDTNPFQLRKPPAWWLIELSIFDPELVIFPSAKTAMYRLARRVKNSYGLQVVGKLHNHPDTTLMAAERLVPVTSFLATIEFTTEIFLYLRTLDMWGVGGAEKAADLLDARDSAVQDHLQHEFEGEVDGRSSSAYKAARLRQGQTVFVHDSAPSLAVPSSVPLENGVS